MMLNTGADVIRVLSSGLAEFEKAQRKPQNLKPLNPKSYFVSVLGFATIMTCHRPSWMPSTLAPLLKGEVPF